MYNYFFLTAPALLLGSIGAQATLVDKISFNYPLYQKDTQQFNYRDSVNVSVLPYRQWKEPTIHFRCTNSSSEECMISMSSLSPYFPLTLADSKFDGYCDYFSFPYTLLDLAASRHRERLQGHFLLLRPLAGQGWARGSLSELLYCAQ